MKKLMSALSVLCWLSVLPIYADEAKHKQLAEAFLTHMNVERLLDKNVEDLVQNEMRANPQYELFEATIRDYFQKNMGWEGSKSDFIDAVIGEYSEDDLTVIIAFYETTAGEKVLKGFPVVLEQGILAGQTRVTEHVETLQHTIKAEAAKMREHKHDTE